MPLVENTITSYMYVFKFFSFFLIKNVFYITFVTSNTLKVYVFNYLNGIKDSAVYQLFQAVWCEFTNTTLKMCFESCIF